MEPPATGFGKIICGLYTHRPSKFLGRLIISDSDVEFTWRVNHSDCIRSGSSPIQYRLEQCVLVVRMPLPRRSIITIVYEKILLRNILQRHMTNECRQEN